MSLSRSKGFGRNTLIRCCQLAGIRKVLSVKITIRKDLKEVSISLSVNVFSRDRSISVISYEVPQTLHGYWGIYTSAVSMW